jgi:hypothetical protein
MMLRGLPQMLHAEADELGAQSRVYHGVLLTSSACLYDVIMTSRDADVNQ